MNDMSLEMEVIHTKHHLITNYMQTAQRCQNRNETRNQKLIHTYNHMKNKINQ